jgi:hypothetical protein
MAELGSLTYSVITANQIRLVEQVNRDRMRGWCGANYFQGAGVTAALWAINTYRVDRVSFWSAIVLSVVLLAVATAFYRTAKRCPSGGVAAILEAEGLPLDTITVKIEAAFVDNAGKPVGTPIVVPENSMVTP